VNASQRPEDEALAAFCEELPGLVEAADRHGLGSTLRQILAQVRAGQPVASQLGALGIPDPDENGRRVGGNRGPGQTTPGGAGPRVEGVSGHSVDEVYTCPAGRCWRRVRREPGGPVPKAYCQVFEQPLAPKS
jgi:hypothetical protein